MVNNNNDTHNKNSILKNFLQKRKKNGCFVYKEIIAKATQKK